MGRVGQERGTGELKVTTATPARTGGEREALARAVVYFLLTRGVLFMVAAAAIRLLPVGLQAGTERYLAKGRFIGTWLRWDAWWYVSVAERGY